MSSSDAQRHIDETALTCLEKARRANNATLRCLALLFGKEQNRSSAQNPIFWKNPLRMDGGDGDIDFVALEDVSAKHSDTFWATLFLQTVECLRTLGVTVHWASFALEEFHGGPEAKFEGTFGFPHSIIFYTAADKPNDWKPKYSITKRFVAKRLEALQTDADAYERGLGVCVTKNLQGDCSEELHFLCTDQNRFASNHDAEIANAFTSEFKDVEDVWAEYIQSFYQLIPKGKTLDSQISASIFFHSLSDTTASAAKQHKHHNAYAGAQLIIGLEDALSANQARLIYNCLAIELSGIPALYSGLIQLSEEAEQLRKFRDAFQLIQRPLRGISNALSGIQTDSQELRAVLYEPEEALFASYSLIEPFFRGSRKISFPKANLDEIKVEHTPDHYTDSQIRLATAVICSAVFGEQDKLLEEQDESGILATAAKIMVQASARDSLKNLAEDLKWLVEHDLIALFQTPAPKAGWPEKDRYVTALNNIKAALFTPFKMDANQWPQAALQLLHRDRCFAEAGTKLKILGTDKTNEPPSSNPLPDVKQKFPCSYATLITFLRDVAYAATASDKQTDSMSFDESPSAKFSLVFRQEPHIEVSYIRERCYAVLGLDRNWRVEGANYGDMTRAFVLFTNRLLGIGTQWSGNENKPTDATTIIHLVRNGHTFSVSWKVSDKTLSIETT